MAPHIYIGMDDMLPNYAPYIPRLFKVQHSVACVYTQKIAHYMYILTRLYMLCSYFNACCFFFMLQKLTVLVGEPIDVSGLLKSQAELSVGAVIIRKQITDVIQKKLYDLRTHAEELHKSWTTSSLVAFRTL